RAPLRSLGRAEPVLRALGRPSRGTHHAPAARGRARLRAPGVRECRVGAIVDPRRTVVIEGVAPAVDGGRYPVKREVGAVLEVTADIFTEGHDVLVAYLKYRCTGEHTWRETPMRHVDNDRWAGALRLDAVGRWVFTIEALVEPYGSWLADLAKRHAVRADLASALHEGLALIRAAAAPAAGVGARALTGGARRRWASTSSTCRPSTRSGAPTARARTTRPWPSPATRAAPGRSGARRAATRPCTRSSAPSTTSTGSSSAPGASGSRWRSTSRSSARPTTRGSPCTRSGSSIVPTARSSTPRTRRRSTRRSEEHTSELQSPDHLVCRL